MSPKFLAGVYLIWVTLTIFASAMDGLMFIEGRESMLEGFSTVQFANIQGTGFLAIPLFIGGFVQTLPSLVVWNYPWLNNDIGFYVKIVLLYPISLAFIVSIVLLMATIMQSKAGTIAVVSGVIGAAGATLLSLLS